MYIQYMTSETSLFSFLVPLISDFIRFASDLFIPMVMYNVWHLYHQTMCAPDY